MTEPSRRRSRWLFLLIPMGAFSCGLITTLAASQLRQQPLRAVYRQEAVPVVAPLDGILASVEHPYGSVVRPGDALAKLESTSIPKQLATLRIEESKLRRRLDAVIAQAAVELALRQADVEKERLEMRLRCADLLRSRLDVQTRRKALQEPRPDGDRLASGPSTVSLASGESPELLHRLDLADLTNHEEVLSAQIALCDDRLAELDLLKTELTDQINRSCGVNQLKRDLADVAKRLSELEAASLSSSILCPAHGRVGIYRKKAGDYLAAGETIVEVFDAERPYLLVTAPIETIHDLPVDRRVRVEFHGIKTRKPLEGTVTEVAHDAERDANSATAPGTSVARIRIEPVGRLWPPASPGTTAFIRPLE